ncbi:MAG: NAD(P)-dependent dehydrogenase (short-subunit alcohol dehydrogenase family) [Thermoproteota archaeon]|jgi:NAD(P)-dependent dehydrogenase (short-subunit alcohol dehydrogenase family)
MKRILITGASTGIGKACALGAAEKGFIVYAGHRKEKDGMLLKKLHENIRPITLDISNSQHIKAAFELISTEGQSIECLFNNAGIAYSGPTECMDMDLFRHQMEINVCAQVEVTQSFIPLLRQASCGRLIFTGSAAGIIAKPLIGAYSASKFALEGLVDTLRLELNPWNIKVALIQPGKVKTEIYKKSYDNAVADRDKMSENAKKLYLPLVDTIINTMKNADSESSDVKDVVDVFLHALLAKSPKTRYPIGGDAKQQFYLKKVLTDKLRDKFILSKLRKLTLKS